MYGFYLSFRCNCDTLCLLGYREYPLDSHGENAVNSRWDRVPSRSHCESLGELLMQSFFFLGFSPQPKCVWNLRCLPHNVATTVVSLPAFVVSWILCLAGVLPESGGVDSIELNSQICEHVRAYIQLTIIYCSHQYHRVKPFCCRELFDTFWICVQYERQTGVIVCIDMLARIGPSWMGCMSASFALAVWLLAHLTGSNPRFEERRHR